MTAVGGEKALKAFVALLLISLSACSFLSDNDGPGKRISVSDVDDAVPGDEAPSKYGNPKSYEVFGVRYYVMESSAGYVERGNASWYGKKFHGRKTSSGEVFDMYKATAAHRSLPLPTYAKVTNLDNGKSMIVKINDRGPFHSDRIIDLSYGAATKLGIAAAGTGRVEVRALNSDGEVPGDSVEVEVTPLKQQGTYVQLGAYSHFVNAQEMRARIAGAGLLGVSVDKAKNQAGEKLYKVRLGPYVNQINIDKTINRLREAGIEDYKLVQ